MTRPMTVARTSQRRQTSATAGQSLGGDDGQHALLALAGHHLPGLHARLAPGDGGDVDVHAHPAAGRGLAGGAGQTGAAEVLDARPPGPASSSSRQASISRFSSKGSPTWTLGRLASSAARRRLAAEAGRGEHAHPADAVAPGGRARAARPGCPAPLARPSTSRSTGSAPRQSTLTSGFWA